MKVHFIAIGGSVMHSLAIALHDIGYQVTGSDDQIYDPARSKLAEKGLLPETEGWDEARIQADLDAVVLGMHAFEDNPELLAAQRLGLPIYSYPEMVYQLSRNKQRIVVAGSYGKTTVTSMIMHVLQRSRKSFDYLVGSQVPGFPNPVKISEDAPIIVIEGDEYLASRLHPVPKFLVYQPHIVLINGISWDHINVFPTEEAYVAQFAQLIRTREKGADIVYNQEDKRLSNLVESLTDDEIHYHHEYKTPPYKIRNGHWSVKIEGESEEVQVIGKHNMLNISAAWSVCELLGIQPGEFLLHIASFKGAGKRLEIILEREDLVVYRDFAHAPEKVAATVDAVRETYKNWNLIACVELHTFSSLNREFLPLYKNSLEAADSGIVFVHEEQFAKRRMTPLSAEEVLSAFGKGRLQYLTEADRLLPAVRSAMKSKNVVLWMSSGNFGGCAIEKLAND